MFIAKGYRITAVGFFLLRRVRRVTERRLQATSNGQLAALAEKNAAKSANDIQIAIYLIFSRFTFSVFKCNLLHC